jgi:hypothetical protein
MRVSASSLRSLATSASSSGTVRLPGITVPALPRLALLTQFASVPLGIAIRCAASSSDSPCANTSLTASARNSGVYVFVCILPSPFDQFIKRECPKKSGYLTVAELADRLQAQCGLCVSISCVWRLMQRLHMRQKIDSPCHRTRRTACTTGTPALPHATYPVPVQTADLCLRVRLQHCHDQALRPGTTRHAAGS